MPILSQPAAFLMDREISLTFAGLPTFFAYLLPLIRLVFFDGLEQSLTLFKHQQLEGDTKKTDIPRLPQTLHNAYPLAC